MKTQRLAMVTTLPHTFVELWNDLNLTNVTFKKGDFSKLTFTLTNSKAVYDVTYESHEFLFILIVEEANTHRKLLHYDHLGLRVIADEYKDQQDIWKAFLEDLRPFCHEVLHESKGGNKI